MVNGQQVSQIAIPAPSKLMFRDKDQDAAPFGAWQHVFSGETKPALSNGVSGYIMFPNGILMQWGVSGASSASGFASINFPITFPKNLFHLLPVDRAQGGGGAAEASVVSWIYDSSYLASAAVRIATPNTGAARAGETVSYLAIGN